MRTSIIYLFILFNSLSFSNAATTLNVKQGIEGEDIKYKNILILSDLVCSDILHLVKQGRSRWRIRLNLDNQKYRNQNKIDSIEICEILKKLHQPLHISNIIRLLTQPLSDKKDLLAQAVLKAVYINGDIDANLKLYTNSQKSVLIAFYYHNDEADLVVRIRILEQNGDFLNFENDMLISQDEHLLLEKWRNNKLK